MPHMLTQYDGVSIFRLFTFQSWQYSGAVQDCESYAEELMNIVGTMTHWLVISKDKIKYHHSMQQ
jgi:hypothetical protein